MTEKLISTAEAAAELGVTPARVQHMIWAGRLPAFKVGRAWVIREADLGPVRNRRPGRPKQAPAAKKRRAA